MHLDAGGFSKDDEKLDVVATRTIFAAYDLMRVQAVNVAARDLDNLGDSLFELAKDAAFPLISANIVDAATQKPLFTPSKVFEVNGLRIGVTGVTMPGRGNLTLKSGVKVAYLDAGTTAAAMAKSLREKADIVIVLTYVPFRNANALAKQLADADLILGADGYTTTWSDQQFAERIVSYSGREGQKVMLLNCDLRGKRLRNATQQIVTLKMSFPEDSEIKRLVDGANAEMQKLMKTEGFAISALQSQVNAKYVGFGACRNCHAEETKIWRASNHYHAFDALIEKGKTGDHSCLPCHTTGYIDRGFVDVRVTPGMVNVQCESCHGAGADHVASPTTVGMPIRNPALACITCHDASNSPNFTFDAYWKKIAHTKSLK